MTKMKRKQSQGEQQSPLNAQARGKACSLVLWVGSFIIELREQ